MALIAGLNDFSLVGQPADMEVTIDDSANNLSTTYLLTVSGSEKRWALSTRRTWVKSLHDATMQFDDTLSIHENAPLRPQQEYAELLDSLITKVSLQRLLQESEQLLDRLVTQVSWQRLPQEIMEIMDSISVRSASAKALQELIGIIDSVNVTRTS